MKLSDTADIVGNFDTNVTWKTPMRHFQSVKSEASEVTLA